MDSDRILIESFALHGYRSIGNLTQHFERFAKVNLFIGQNNCGKSNILRFICDIFPNLSKEQPLKLDKLDRPLINYAPFIVGASLPLDLDLEDKYTKFEASVSARLKDKKHLIDYFLRVCKEKAKNDKTKDAWFYFDESLKLIEDGWKEAFRVLDDRDLYNMWHVLTNHSQGDRNLHWYPETFRLVRPHFSSISGIMIPAIRSVGKKGSTSDNFSGDGIIERLVKLQNPDVHNQSERKKFENINTFLQTVTGNKTSEIEIPHDRETILVHMDNKTLPLTHLGSGIHEVIILAAASTILENTVICMEEPELHLHPLLQKKLIRYLLTFTNNQYFISTHSAALMDTPNAEIYHITLENGQSLVDRVTSDSKKSVICEDLGYHPSDLFQSNCIIWVEGPSDRIYLNYWIKYCAPTFVEGIHYTIMFYGGRLLSHLTGDDIDSAVDDFISLRRLNRRGVIIIDSDKEEEQSPINDTKNRLKTEFDKGPGYSWITEGREMENYIDPEFLKEAIEATKPSSTPISNFGKFENTLSIKTKKGDDAKASKVDVAKHIVQKYEPNFNVFDLKSNVQKLVEFIEASNIGYQT